MESIHSPLHGPAFIPDLKENLDTSPRKKQNKTPIRSPRPVWPPTSARTDLGREPKSCFQDPITWSQAREPPPRLRGGGEPEGRPGGTGGSAPRRCPPAGPAGRRSTSAQGLTARNTPDREQPSLREGRAQRHEEKALPSYRKEGSIPSADNTGLPRTRGPGINAQIATQPPRRSLPLGPLPINNDTKKRGGELRRPRSGPPHPGTPGRGPPGPAHTEKP